MITTVQAIKSERHRHTDYNVHVKAWNEHTNQYETVWTITRSDPFVVQVEHAGEVNAAETSNS